MPSAHRLAPARVVIVGGGLAGLAAACHLADRGHQVTLVEKRPYLGGRTFSFTDTTTGLEVDNGQHIFMKCCTYYIDFLKRLGAYRDTYVQERLAVPIIHPQRGASTLSGAPLPAPLHILPSFLAYRHLSWPEKARAAYALLRLGSLSPQQRQALDNESFGTWLRRHHQTPRAIAHLWDVIALATLNGPAAAVSAGMAAFVFQEAFFKDPHAADIGLARVGLSRLVAPRVMTYIQERGGQVILGRTAVGLVMADGAVKGVALRDGSLLAADRCILALPHHALPKLLPASLRQDAFFRRVSELPAAPIINVHLAYDRPITDLPFAAFLGSPVQWVFNKGWALRLPPPQQYLLISLSGAHQYLSAAKAQLYQLFTSEMARLLPRARDAAVLRFLVTRERYATFLPVPGTQHLRPPQATPIPNLFLAGSWTDTGWPDTMEGAVRSGVLAAQALMASITIPAPVT